MLLGRTAFLPAVATLRLAAALSESASWTVAFVHPRLRLSHLSSDCSGRERVITLHIQEHLQLDPDFISA